MMAECLTVNSREMADERQILMIVCGEEEIPVNGTMLELTPGTDADRLASVLNEQYVNYGKFYTYAYMRSYSKANLLWVKTNLLVQAFLLLLVFFSHFVGYLSVSTRNKMRTNALLSVNGLTPVQLAKYNTCSVLLLLLISLVIGLPLVPFTEKWAKIVAYGGHGVMRDCLAVLCVFVLLLVYFTVRTRLKKGNTILLYRKGM